MSSNRSKMSRIRNGVLGLLFILADVFCIWSRPGRILDVDYLTLTFVLDALLLLFYLLAGLFFLFMTGRRYRRFTVFHLDIKV